MSEQLPPDMIPGPHAVTAGLAGAAAVLIRLTGGEAPRPWRVLLGDGVGTFALAFLLFAATYGSGWNAWLAAGVSGLGATAGWAAVYTVLRQLAQRGGPR